MLPSPVFSLCFSACLPKIALWEVCFYFSVMRGCLSDLDLSDTAFSAITSCTSSIQEGSCLDANNQEVSVLLIVVCFRSHTVITHRYYSCCHIIKFFSSSCLGNAFALEQHSLDMIVNYVHLKWYYQICSTNVPFKLSPNVFDVGMLEMLHWKQLQCWLHIEV